MTALAEIEATDADVPLAGEEHLAHALEDPAHRRVLRPERELLLDRGVVKEAIDHLEAAARLSPQTDYVHYQLQAAYRKESRIAEADRELELYKELKAKSRERTVPQPVQHP